MITRRRLLAAAVSTPVVLAGCKVRTINYFPPSTARVRFANVTLGTAAMNVEEGDSTIWAGVPFEQSVDFTDFENAKKTFRLVPTGGTDTVASVDVTLAGEQSYTLLSYGLPELTQVFLAPDASPNAGDSNFLIRIIDVAARMPGFDAYFTDPLIPVDDQVSPVFVNLQPGGSTVALRFTAGIYSLRLTLVGTKDVVYDSGARVFPGGISTDLVLYSLGAASLPQMMQLDVNDGGVRAVVPSRVSTARVVNGAVQSGAINVTAGAVTLATGLAYAASTLYLGVAVGPNTVSAEAASTPGAPIATLDADFASARDQTLVVLGLAGAVRIVVLTDDNHSPASGQSRVRFVNASSDVAAYDVYVGDTKVVAALPAGQAAPYVVLNAGTETVTFRDPGTGATVLTIADYLFDDGLGVSMFAVGTVGALASVVNIDR